MDLNRKKELEKLIADSYSLIREWEQIRQIGRPEEKLEARRRIDAQWDNIARYLDEYRPLVGGVLPDHIAQIAAHFGPVKGTPGGQEQPTGAGTTYNVHIEKATGVAIGNGARVIGQPGSPGED